MSLSARKFLLGLALVLGTGTLIGWYYGSAERGFLVAAAVSLMWQARNLLAFERAIRSGDFGAFRYGDGIWQQIFSRFSFELEKSARYKNEYRRLLKELHKSTDAMPDGAVIVDENNEILFCNRAAKVLAGLKRKKDRGQRVDNILRAPVLTVLLGEVDATQVVEIASPVKDDAWLNCRIVPYGSGQKMLVLRDITERKKLTKMRRDFVANASHELRSPLTVVTGYLDSIAGDADMPPDWQQPVEQMRTQVQRMAHIVSELLELSRLESAGQAPTEEVVDVNGLLAAARKQFEQPGAAPAISVESESMATLLGSSSEIESVITNIVSNAVRHTPADGEISLGWRSGADGAELIVRDTGEGIAAEHLSRLTERFFRIDRGRAREDGGVGLGLAIVKHILSRHDGELRIASTMGEGSEFTCHFAPERVAAEAPVPLVGDMGSA